MAGRISVPTSVPGITDILITGRPNGLTFFPILFDPNSHAQKRLVAAVTVPWHFQPTRLRCLVVHNYAVLMVIRLGEVALLLHVV